MSENGKRALAIPIGSSIVGSVAIALTGNSFIEFEASGSAQAIAAVVVANVPTGGTVTLLFNLEYQTD